MKVSIPLIAALAAGGMLTGCSEERAAPPPPPVKKAAPKEAAAPIAPVGPAYVYAYNPVAKRDPFRSPVEEVRQITANETLCTDPLCQFDLDQLTLVAVV